MSSKKSSNNKMMYPDSLDTRCGSQKQIAIGEEQNDEATNTFNQCKAGLQMTTEQIDGIFKLFNAVGSIKSRVSIKKTFKRLKRRAFKAKGNNTRSMPIMIDDKENIRPTLNPL